MGHPRGPEEGQDVPREPDERVELKRQPDVEAARAAVKPAGRLHVQPLDADKEQAVNHAARGKEVPEQRDEAVQPGVRDLPDKEGDADKAALPSDAEAPLIVFLYIYIIDIHDIE